MIDLIIDKNCTGCHSCYNICSENCISMIVDVEGFWYPKVDYNKCIKCSLCKTVCPIINKTTDSNKLSAYACINKEEDIRLESSSGGIFNLIAEEIIGNGGVVFGAKFDRNFDVVHSYVETKEELFKFRGSKYVQSRIGDTYRQAKKFLEKNRLVLFTGTPCQIAGLKSYLRDFYYNLFCIDIICHGVPSPRVWKKYVNYRETLADSSIKRISFRSKNEGWKRFSLSFIFENNTEYCKTLDKDLYLKAFLKDICLRPSCYECEFKGLNRQSDITLADFWGVWHIMPEMDDDKGTSLIFTNSTVGESMLEKIKDKILCKEVDIVQAISYNTAAIKSVGHNKKREKFFQELDKLSFDRLVQKHCADSLLIRVKRKLTYLVYNALIKVGLLKSKGSRT